MKHLAVAVKSQHVTLRDDAGITLLPSLLRCIETSASTV
jgi:hypothetical protein